MIKDEIENDKSKKTMQIITTDCWKCKKEMKLAIIIAEGGPFDPSDFNKDQIKIAESKGIILKKHYSNTIEEEYLANTCPHCGNFIGQFFMHHYLYDPNCEEILL